MTIDPATDLREISTQFIRQQAVAALPDDLPSIILDGSRLSKMLMAIRDNAVKFSDTDGKILLNTAVTYTNELRISVTNTGVGIS